MDNAIVVVEAVHAKMHDEHLSPYYAVKKVLGEISGAIIAITLIMTAVFVPVAFMTGPVGILSPVFNYHGQFHCAFRCGSLNTYTRVVCHDFKNNHGMERKNLLPTDLLIGLTTAFKVLPTSM